jgi:hypothetical protein
MDSNYRPAQGYEVRCWECANSDKHPGYHGFIACPHSAHEEKVVRDDYTCGRAERRVA